MPAATLDTRLNPSLSAGPSQRMPLPTDDALPLLDQPAEWDRFSTAVEGGSDVLASSLVVEGMTCAACALSVEAALRAVPGVDLAEVSAASGRARVVWRPDAVLPSAWMQAVRRAGYGIVPAIDHAGVTLRRAQSRKMLWRWLVAGLCMMQVMMYAYPAYVALPGDLSLELETLLRWASWVLSLPVLLFSCGPFFRDAWTDLLQRRIGMDLPVALAILITFAVSTAGTFDPLGTFGREVYFDSLTMFVFFLLTGRWLEVRLRERTAGALESVLNRLPQAVTRIGADGSAERIAVRQLLRGDRLRVRPGEAFPADGVLLQGTTDVDEALLTGESAAQPRQVGDAVIAGSLNLSGSVEMRVDRLGADTRLSGIVGLMQQASVSKPRLARLADRIAPYFLLVVLVCAGGALAFWWPQDPGHAWMVAVAVLVVTCPCALSLATPTAMLASAGALARRGVLVRDLQGLETLAGVTMVVFDKTGTLTEDKMAVRSVSVRPGADLAVACAAANALAEHSLHPLSRALAAQAQDGANLLPSTASAVQEQPGRGVMGQVAVAGAELGLVRLGSAEHCGLAPARATGVDDEPEVHLADGQGWLATFTLGQAVRADAQAAVQALQGKGLRVVMLSGDREVPAQRIAKALGLDEWQSGCTPQDKLVWLHRRQAAGERVAMVGDGINDAPVLAAADVAFAVGASAPLARSQADFVLPGGQLMAVAQSLALSRSTLRVVRQNLGWAALYNLSCVPLAVVGWLPAWLAGLGMAGSSLVVLANALRLARPIDAAQEQR